MPSRAHKPETTVSYCIVAKPRTKYERGLPGCNLVSFAIIFCTVFPTDTIVTYQPTTRRGFAAGYLLHSFDLLALLADPNTLKAFGKAATAALADEGTQGPGATSQANQRLQMAKIGTRALSFIE